MSGFDNNTNRRRVEKMIEILGHLEASAKSNKAEPEEVAEMLAPLLKSLAMGPVDTAPNDPVPVKHKIRPRDYVETLNDHDLADLLTLTAMQIEERVFEIKGSRFEIANTVQKGETAHG